MTWPIDDLDLSLPHYTRAKSLAAVNKLKAMLACTPLENVYYMVVNYSDVEGYFFERDKSASAASWTLGPDTYDGFFVVNHNLGLVDTDQFHIHIQGSGGLYYTGEGRGGRFTVWSQTANSFQVRAQGPDLLLANIMCFNYDSSATPSWPIDDLSTSNINQGTDTCVNGRADLHSAGQKLQALLASDFPPAAGIYVLVVAFGPEQTTQGILNRSASAASWTFSQIDSRTFRITHNLGLTTQWQLAIKLTAGRGRVTAPTYVGGTTNASNILQVGTAGPFYKATTGNDLNAFDVFATKNEGETSTADGSGIFYIQARVID